MLLVVVAAGSAGTALCMGQRGQQLVGGTAMSRPQQVGSDSACCEKCKKKVGCDAWVYHHKWRTCNLMAGKARLQPADKTHFTAGVITRSWGVRRRLAHNITFDFAHGRRDVGCGKGGDTAGSLTVVCDIGRSGRAQDLQFSAQQNIGHAAQLLFKCHSWFQTATQSQAAKTEAVYNILDVFHGESESWKGQWQQGVIAGSLAACMFYFGKRIDDSFPHFFFYCNSFSLHLPSSFSSFCCLLFLFCWVRKVWVRV